MARAFPRPTHRRLPRPLALALLVAAGSLPACRSRATPAQCTEMLDRYLALTSPPEALPSNAADATSRRSGEAYLRARRRCAEETTSDEHRCAMRAPTADAWEACID